MTKALIIGGGIAGPAAAMALQQAGIQAAVYEGYDRPADYAGLFLNTASNGLDALRAVGVDAADRADGVPIPRMVMWSGTGRRLGEVANGTRLDDGTVSVCVKRGTLQRVLRDEATSRGIPFEYGKRLVGYETTPGGGVEARFADGTTATGDLLIGADGVRSRTRELLDPAGPAPSYTGQLSVGGYSRVPGVAPTPDTQHFVFGKRAFFGYLVRESGEIYWFANLGHPDTSGRALAEIPTAEWHRRLEDLFSDDLPRIGEIIAATTGEIGAYPIHDLPTSPVWHRSPVVLLGDAVHATSPTAGQGASLACEDAIVLAKCLRDLPDHASAFAAYERIRRARVEKVVAYGRRVGNTKIAGPIGRVLRDLAMPLALKLFANPKSQEWVFRYHIDWKEPIAQAA